MPSPTPETIANALDGYIGTDWRTGVFKGVMDCGGAEEDLDATIIDAGNSTDDFGDDDDYVDCVDILV